MTKVESNTREVDIPLPEQNSTGDVTLASVDVSIVGRSGTDQQQAKRYSLQSNDRTLSNAEINVEVAKSLRCGQAGGDLAGAADNPDEVQSIRPTADKPPHVKCRVQKVESGRFSKLGRWILLNTGDGIERGAIVEGFYKLERRYCVVYRPLLWTKGESRL